MFTQGTGVFQPQKEKWKQKGKKMKKTDFHAKIEETKDKVEALQKGVEELKQTGIKENVLFNLIKMSSQKHCSSSNHPLTIGDVRAIIKGIQSLKEYMFYK